MTMFPCIDHALERRRTTAPSPDRVIIMEIADEIYRKAQNLPADRARNVLDFIDFLETKYGSANGSGQADATARRSGRGHVSDNADDEVWSDLLFRQ